MDRPKSNMRLVAAREDIFGLSVSIGLSISRIRTYSRYRGSRITASHGPSSNVKSAIMDLMPANHSPKNSSIIDKRSWT
jgi:hypothetical protein